VIKISTSDPSHNAERLWRLTFTTTERMENGLSKSIWLLSLGLASHSTPAWVEAELLVSRQSQVTDPSDPHEHVFSAPFGNESRELQPGLQNAITVRLDNGPMGPHLQNEFV
jgi:hypothetical protein